MDARSRPRIATRSPGSKRSLGCLVQSCSRSGVARPISGATSCRITRCACSRHRGIWAAAGIISGRSFWSRSRWSRTVSRAPPRCEAPGAARWGSRNSCRRNSTSMPSISTATAARIFSIRCRMRSPPRQSSSPPRAGSAASAGPMKCARRQISIARKGCRKSSSRYATGSGSASRPPMIANCPRWNCRKMRPYCSRKARAARLS